MEKRSVKTNRPVNRWKWAFTVLLAVIVLAGVALAFLGGKKMEETKKLKFPVASIFTVFVIAGMAIEKQMKADELEAIVFPHPTVGEIIKEALG